MSLIQQLKQAQILRNEKRYCAICPGTSGDDSKYVVRRTGTPDLFYL